MKYEKNFSMVNRAIRQRLAIGLKPYHLNESNFMLVLLICETPGISQEVLNRQIYREHSIVTKSVKRLAEHGWISIQPDPRDRRRKQLFPTNRALSTYPKILAVAEAANQWVAAGLTATERDQLDTLLEKLAGYVEDQS